MGLEASWTGAGVGVVASVCGPGTVWGGEEGAGLTVIFAGGGGGLLGSKRTGKSSPSPGLVKNYSPKGTPKLYRYIWI